QNAGTHTVVWNGTDNNGKNVSSGVYFYRMKNGSYSKTNKMILMK
ncbi:MAG: FlgD immunoglobulin-like domain containing protein, partial [Candidatus Cloacimonadales bacterium]